MPFEIRELLAELERAGFVNRGGKGNHRLHAPERGQARHHLREPGGRRQALSGSGRAFSHSGVEDMRDSARYAKVVEWISAMLGVSLA